MFAPNKKPGNGIFQRLLLRFDEHVSVKLLLRLWGPRLECFVRLMLVATFFDDSFRIAMNFSEHTTQVGEQGCLRWLVASTSPGFVGTIATVVLGLGLLLQSLGSFCLLVLYQPDIATRALILWAITQPMLYAQMSNVDLVAESLSLVGGLQMLRVHLVLKQKATKGAGAAATAWRQLVGRLLFPAAYLYRAGCFLNSAFTLDETSNLAAYVSSLSLFFVKTVLLVGLVVGSMLVAAGLRSRFVALLLSLVNLVCVCYQHPFFRYVWFENGEWKVDEINMLMPRVALPFGVALGEFTPWQIYDLHRYYFFLGLSTSGALLLLAQFGPGTLALQQDELLLPMVARAQD